jgi:hypothetical protein
MKTALQSFIESTFPLDFLEIPEKYLGPNYRAVMNFYTLSYNGTLRRTAAGHYNWPCDRRYNLLLQELVLEFTPNEIKRRLPYPLPVFELITMHLLLERGETLQYIPLFTIKDGNNEF